ncbi:MAG: N-acetylmuramic acid 6-phosphate etherase [Planctomycetes bacterium]|nr:N-acetylmuramic acid 6-phosphate etherase [Planctomycetota bacterium]
MDDRGSLTTELRNPRSMRLDQLDIGAAFDLIQSEDATITSAVAAARADICRAIDLVVSAFSRGGRLIYVGAGTSGRLGVLDAAECPPTFLTDPSMVVGIIAGGKTALTSSIEGAEDSPEEGGRAIDAQHVCADDLVFGIATGGTTPFVHGALARAKERGARTVFFACVSKTEVADGADVSIRVITGGEVLTGSTRMKAGTATKMVLNMVTTIAMTRIGKVYQNLMVDVRTGANRKLVDRAVRIIGAVTRQSRDAAAELLERADGRVKTALVMHHLDVDREEALRRLESAGGFVHEVLNKGVSSHA